jgi:Ca2+-transporting ATPase
MKILNFKQEHKGLDSEKAQENLELYGYNSEKRRVDLDNETPKMIRFYSVFKSLRVYLMLAAVFVYFLNNSDNSAIKGGLLLLLMFGICAFEIIIENICSKKLREVTNTSRVIVRVVRDGEIKLVRREEIVQDDLIILQGGETVPADAHILESNDVMVDESAFSDSDTPVKKQAGYDGKRELKQSCVYKRTKILSGLLIARVFATGPDTKIRPEVLPKKAHYTELESFIGKISTLCTYAAAILLVIVTVIKLIAAGGTEPEVTEGMSALTYLSGIFLPSISFALCAIPVSLALIIRLYYVIGAAKLSYKYGDVKRLKGVETLNSVTAICVDKDVIVDADSTPIAAESGANKNMLARVAALSCNKSPVNSYERAISISAAFKHIDVKDLYENTLIKSYAPEAKDYNNIHGNLWEINGAKLLCVKGTPEKVLSFCNLPDGQLYPIQQKHSEYAKEGHYVQAVAFTQLKDEVETDEEGNVIGVKPAVIPKALYDVEYTYLGLLAYSSSINENVPAAVKNCYRAGIKIYMLTSDNRETASAVAHKAGIREDGIVEYSGEKLEVVQSLKEAGEVTAVFGGGVSGKRLVCSCTSALELSDVGIALSKYTTPKKWDMDMQTMSELTTGSACEACDFVMDAGAGGSSEISACGFVKAIDAFMDARIMHRNIKRCISVAIATFIAVFLFGLVSLIAIGDSGADYVLEAVFVSTLSVLVTVLLTFFYIENDSDSKSNLRSSTFVGRRDKRYSRNFLFGTLIQGMSLFAAAAIMFVAFRFNENYEAAHLRSIFFAVFMAGTLAMSWVGLSYDKPFYSSVTISKWKTNPALILTAVLLLFVIMTVYLPFVNSAFGLTAINPLILIVSLIIGGVSQLWFDFIKKRFYN